MKNGNALTSRLPPPVRGSSGTEFQNVGLLNHMRKLADIPRPIKFAKIAKRLGIRPPDRPGVLFGISGREEFNEFRDVVHPLAQWRDVQLDHIEPIEEVFAKPAGRNLSLEIAIRRRQYLHVDRQRMRCPDRRHFALLQHSQQLRLQLKRHFADFIEEGDPAVGCPKHAERAAQCAGERPFSRVQTTGFPPECSSAPRS